MPSGITVHSSPTSLQPLPAYNPQWFVASSTNVAQPNFKYQVVLTDLLTGGTLTEYVIPNPSNKIEFNAQYFAELYMANYLPKNIYGWKKCVDAVRKIRVNIGESYGTSPVYVSGSNIDYVTWNAAIDEFDFASYSPNTYCYDSSIPNYAFLTYTGRSNTYEDRSEYLYTIIQEGVIGDLPDITIKSYDESGTLLGTSVIARPDNSTGLYTDNYVCIDVGKKGLDNIAGGLVTGTYPILPANTSYYTVSDLNSPGGVRGIVKTLTIKCSPRYKVYTIHYLKKTGGWGTLHCSLLAELITDNQSTTAKRNTWRNVSNVMTMDPEEAVEFVQSNVHIDKLRLNTDWLIQDEWDYHKDLNGQPAYIDTGKDNKYIPCRITNNSYAQRASERLRQLTIDVKLLTTNYRQRG